MSEKKRILRQFYINHRNHNTCWKIWSIKKFVWVFFWELLKSGLILSTLQIVCKVIPKCPLDNDVIDFLHNPVVFTKERVGVVKALPRVNDPDLKYEFDDSHNVLSQMTVNLYLYLLAYPEDRASLFHQMTVGGHIFATAPLFLIMQNVRNILLFCECFSYNWGIPFLVVVSSIIKVSLNSLLSHNSNPILPIKNGAREPCLGFSKLSQFFWSHYRQNEEMKWKKQANEKRE